MAISRHLVLPCKLSCTTGHAAQAFLWETLLGEGHRSLQFLLLLCSFLAGGHGGSFVGSGKGKEVPSGQDAKALGVGGIPKEVLLILA